MMTNLFTQFDSPKLLAIPLAYVSLTFSSLVHPKPSDRWLTNRVTTIQSWLLKWLTFQLFGPINIRGHKWALGLMSLLIYLITINMLGLLPYTFTPTTQLSITLGLAVPLWLATVIVGFRNDPVSAVAHFVPEGAPTPLIPLLVVIETISLFIRPVALGVRLMANLTAGHLLLQLCATATLALVKIFPPVAVITASLLAMLAVLELAVAVIQAYVFTLLISLYLQENI
uniref:ATP synthase F0 subunit 6 n=1 Tax=Eucinostomus gula TaxID=435273 RepID=UPI0028FC9D4B|nr:ATP synthase F0 subunit 6 [Eucinostomus gula]WNH21457.1 ATP synthase F0 subunit 6 [Eucinostomus gula]WNH37969.1 ATP synthase F0 subunit 6 [Eucinostomus gula]